MGYLTCPLCDKIEFSDVQELQQHIACALTKSLSCPICSATLKGLHSMHVHLANHIPINGYEDIGKTLVLSSPDHFPALERLDIQDDPSSPKESQRSPSVGLYDKVDKNVITYNCNQCGLVFASDHFLTLHKDLVHIHACSYEVTCKQCKSRFKSLELYRDHVRETHSDRRYICDQCPKSFKWKGGLVVHNRMCHDQNSPTTCTGCKKKFSSKYRRDVHMKKCHAVKKAKLERSRLGSVSTECLNYASETDVHSMMQQPPSCSSLITNSSSAETISSPAGGLSDVSKVMDLEKPISIDDNHDMYYGHQNLDRQVSSPPVLVQNSITEDIHGHSFIPKENPDVEMQEPHLPCLQNQPFTPGTLDDGQSSSPFSLDNESPQSSPQDNLNIDLPSPKEPEMNKDRYFNPNRPEEILGVCDKMNQRNTILQNLKALSNMEYDDFLKATLQSSLSSKAHLNFNYIPLLMEGKQLEEEKNENINSPSTHIDFLKHVQLPEEIHTNSTSLIEDSEENMVPASTNKEIPNELPPPHVDVFHKMEETIGKLSYENKELNESEISTSNQKDDNFVSPPACSFPTTKVPPTKTTTSGRTTGTKSWECDECKKCFTTKYFLKKHKRLHTGETPYSCGECGKTYTFQQSFHKHLFYHSSDKPHICPHCGRAFKEMSTLHNHIRIHTGEKPFTCTTCGKAFRQRVSFLVHQRIHTGQMPYHCDACDRSFRYKVSLRSHKCDKKNEKRPENTEENNSPQPDSSVRGDTSQDNMNKASPNESKEVNDLFGHSPKQIPPDATASPTSVQEGLVQHQSCGATLPNNLPAGGGGGTPIVNSDAGNKSTSKASPISIPNTFSSIIDNTGKIDIYDRPKSDIKRINNDDRSRIDENVNNLQSQSNLQQYILAQNYQSNMISPVIPSNDINTTTKHLDFHQKSDILTGTYPPHHPHVPPFQPTTSSMSFESNFLAKLHPFAFGNIDPKQGCSKSPKNNKELIESFGLHYDHDTQSSSELRNKSPSQFSSSDLSPVNFTPMNLDDDIDNEIFLKSLFNE